MLAVTESKAVEQQQLPVDGSLQLPRDLCVCRINIKQTVFLILVLGVSAALVPIGDFADRNLSLSNYKFHIYFCTYVGVGKSLWWLSMPKDVLAATALSAVFLVTTLRHNYYWARRTYPVGAAVSAALTSVHELGVCWQ